MRCVCSVSVCLRILSQILGLYFSFSRFHFTLFSVNCVCHTHIFNINELACGVLTHTHTYSTYMDCNVVNTRAVALHCRTKDSFFVIAHVCVCCLLSLGFCSHSFSSLCFGFCSQRSVNVVNVYKCYGLHSVCVCVRQCVYTCTTFHRMCSYDCEREHVFHQLISCFIV